MFSSLRSLVLALAAVCSAASLRADDKKPYTGPGCAGDAAAHFRDEVWAKVGVRKCLTCHKVGGEAEESKFILKDPRRVEGAAADEAMKHNRDAFTRVAGA